MMGKPSPAELQAVSQQAKVPKEAQPAINVPMRRGSFTYWV